MMHSHTSDDWVHIHKINILNLFDPESLLINTESVVKNKLKYLLEELKMFKILTTWILPCKKIDEHKITPNK